MSDKNARQGIVSNKGKGKEAPVVEAPVVNNPPAPEMPQVDVTATPEATAADPKKRLATWDASELLEKGLLKLVYDPSVKLENLVFDLKTFMAGNTNVTWEKLDDCTKKLFANGFKQKAVDKLAGKGKKAGYTLKEQRDIIVVNSARILEKRMYSAPSEGKAPKEPAITERELNAKVNSLEATDAEMLRKLMEKAGIKLPQAAPAAPATPEAPKA